MSERIAIDQPRRKKALKNTAVVREFCRYRAIRTPLRTRGPALTGCDKKEQNLYLVPAYNAQNNAELEYDPTLHTAPDSKGVPAMSKSGYERLGRLEAG